MLEQERMFGEQHRQERVPEIGSRHHHDERADHQVAGQLAWWSRVMAVRVRREVGRIGTRYGVSHLVSVSGHRGAAGSAHPDGASRRRRRQAATRTLAADAGPVPRAFVARTRQAYLRPGVRPLSRTGLVAAVALLAVPPSVDVHEAE